MSRVVKRSVAGRASGCDVVVSALPCPHVYGNVVFNSTMLCGMKLILHPRFDPNECLAAIQTHKATMFEGVSLVSLYVVLAVLTFYE